MSPETKATILKMVEGQDELTLETAGIIKDMIQAELDADFAAAGVDVSADMAADQAEVDAKLAAVAAELDQDMAFVEEQMAVVDDAGKQVQKTLDEMEADQIKKDLVS